MKTQNQTAELVCDRACQLLGRHNVSLAHEHYAPILSAFNSQVPSSLSDVDNAEKLYWFLIGAQAMEDVLKLKQPANS